MFLRVEMQPARLLLLDKPSGVSQGPPTELRIKREEERHMAGVNVYNSKFNTFLNGKPKKDAFSSVSTLIAASVLLLGVCGCNHCTAGVRSEVLLNKIQLSRHEQS